MNKPILLIDIDDVIYPFLETWNASSQNTKHISTDYDPHNTHPEYLEEILNFIKTHDTSKVQPYNEAINALNILSEDYTIIAVTSRDITNMKETTQTWMSKNAPTVTDIIFTRAYFKASPQSKANVANIMQAAILIDDSSEEVEQLHNSTKGYIVKRPASLTSDQGAMSWKEILKDLGY